MTVTIHDELRSLIRMHLDGIPAHTLRGLLRSSNHGPYTDLQIDNALTRARADGFADIDLEGRWFQTPFSAAVDRYQLAVAMQESPVREFLRRCFGRWAWKLWLTAFLLLSTVAGCMQLAHGQEVPAWVMRGIAAQETGVHWNDTGDIDGKWARGTTGAVGPWHISLAVLSDLKLSAHADRLNRDPVYAESVTRLWLTHLHGVTGDWHQACAAWRAGLWNRHRAWARAYADRAYNYGTSY